MPLITISRGIGCGGMIIARLVAEGLKLELFDDDRLEQELFKMGIHEEGSELIKEKQPGFLDQIFSSKAGIYLDYLEAAIYEVAKKGEGVIIGHGSQMLLRDFECALHVRIQATESKRIQNLMTQKGIGEDAAWKLIHKRDHEQGGFFQYAFHKDWNDPALYDLIINTEQIDLDLAAKLVMEAAGSEQIRACSLNALESMERMSLKKKIHAALVENNIQIAFFNIDVPEKGIAEISGLCRSENEKEDTIRIVKALSDVKEVRAKMVVTARYY
jgi:cytidylate kinase